MEKYIVGYYDGTLSTETVVSCLPNYAIGWYCEVDITDEARRWHVSTYPIGPFGTRDAAETIRPNPVQGGPSGEGFVIGELS